MLAAHIARVTWGWLLLLTCGVATWILPRWGQERRRVWLAAGAYAYLNAALWLVALAPWLPAGWPNAAGGALQAVACLAAGQEVDLRRITGQRESPISWRRQSDGQSASPFAHGNGHIYQQGLGFFSF